MGNLAGKAIIVTGAGRGLGQAFAIRAAQQGASVVVNDLNNEAASDTVSRITATGAKAIAVPGSIADWAKAAELIEVCQSEFGSVDGLVNNAALHYLELPWDEQEDRVRTLIEVNVLGTLYCGIHALKAMKEQRSGAIVNVTSGAHLGMGLRSTYGASKGAVASATYGWALEAMPYNIRVNALSPVANTPMTTESFDEEVAKYPERKSAAKASPGMPPLATPEMIAPLVTYLLSDKADGITGQIVRMAGDSFGFVAHPMTVPPMARMETNDEDVVAAAFDRTLRAELKPIGVMAQSYSWNPEKA